MKFYRGAAAAARSYVEANHSRADDYYLAEGSGVATRYIVDVGEHDAPIATVAGYMDGETYERWVAGYDVDTGAAKGRLRNDEKGLRFVEVVINGPKSWSLAAAEHPQIADAYEAAQDRAVCEVISWIGQHSTTRVGPRGRQVQVPADQIEAAVIRHYTSRAGDPHRHLHVQVNARVLANGRWRGLHSVGTVDSIEAINGIGHAAIACDPEMRRTLAAHGYTLDADGEIRELKPYIGRFSQRSAQVGRNLDRYEAEWRRQHPGEVPGPALRRGWDRRAWAEHRPDKDIPVDGAALVDRWREELHELGYVPPDSSVVLEALPIARLDRTAVVDLVLSRLGTRRSAWNAADIRGEVEKIVVSVGIIADGTVRRELAEDLTSQTVAACTPLLDRDDVPEHVRSLSSKRVVQVEEALVSRLADRGQSRHRPVRVIAHRRVRGLDSTQRGAVAAIAGTAPLVVIEGAAGAGKTTTLAAADGALRQSGRRLLVVTPTLKAARVASRETKAPASTAHWLALQHGFRWDEDGHFGRVPATDRIRLGTRGAARLQPGDVLLVDEAGMLDQDLALALITIADEHHARVVLVGDRHQLPAVGRGGVLDHAARWAHPTNVLELSAIHRFADEAYGALSLRMRSGQHPGEVFDELAARGAIVVHPTTIERTAALAEVAASGTALVMADTREQVSLLNATARENRATTTPTQRHRRTPTDDASVVTGRGELISLGDRVTTRLNRRDLGVANRDTWTVTQVAADGRLRLNGRTGTVKIPAEYVRDHVELGYATTVYGAQGETVDTAHVAIDQTTGAAAAYVAMTRGREHNVAHLVADDFEDARRQWIEVFSRDRADLGPGHAAERAAADLDAFGPQRPRSRPGLLTQGEQPRRRRPEQTYPLRPSVFPRPSQSPSSPGIGL
ncbi:MobF family relaxase [Nocardioides albus]|uniref:Conjugative relaxase-like TrwC/TraI family protein n=1 Tax=Nocardioides albus TaxID=1841 RepID=A0A7W5A9C9_9ACTN|nr:MobF family relaxase [Nocardioides albus]MBB3092083.1 conjugative relaxase-like TrwC/TraI family protein [Nocardioides albus]